MLFEELAELCGQRNAIDGRIVEIVAQIDRDQLWGMTGARSLPALVAWKTGCSPANAQTIATIADRLTEFPRCAQALSEGRLSLDQVGVIAARAGQGSDEHYAQLAQCATVTQLRTAVKLEPRPAPDAEPDPELEPKPECSFSCLAHRGGLLLPDHLGPSRGREVRCRGGVASGCVDQPMETRQRHRQNRRRVRSAAPDAVHR